LSNKLYLNTYIYRTPDPSSDPEGFRINGDISAYLIQMDIKRGEGGSAKSVVDDYRRLKRESFWNLLDPMIWIAIWQMGRYWFSKEDSFQIPMLNYKSIGFVPSARFNLTPLGSEAYLDLYIKKDSILLTPYLRYGNGPEGRFYGGGIEMDAMPIKKDFLIAGEIDWWHQPTTENGYHLMTNVTKYITEQIAFTIKTGLKSKGYLMGRNFDVGRYGACGINLVF